MGSSCFSTPPPSHPKRCHWDNTSDPHTLYVFGRWYLYGFDDNVNFDQLNMTCRPMTKGNDGIYRTAVKMIDGDLLSTKAICQQNGVHYANSHTYQKNKEHYELSFHYDDNMYTATMKLEKIEVKPPNFVDHRHWRSEESTKKTVVMEHSQSNIWGYDSIPNNNDIPNMSLVIPCCSILSNLWKDSFNIVTKEPVKHPSYANSGTNHISTQYTNQELRRITRRKEAAKAAASSTYTGSTNTSSFVNPNGYKWGDYDGYSGYR